tara:strand:+ start:4567 stop:5847 length:1281 start_codon:yes stop_codon:yes gene_type:complete
MGKITSILFICLCINNSFSQIPDESKIVNLNSLGYNITNYKMNERIVAKTRPSYLNHSQDVLILGSSRVMKIDESFFKEKNIINAGISGAILQDLLAIYYSYYKNNIKPKSIIIGIDPWLLNNNDIRWKVIKDDFEKMKKVMRSQVVEDSVSSQQRIKLKNLYHDSLFTFSPIDSINIENSYSFLMSDLKIEKLRKNKLKQINKIIKQPDFYDILDSVTEIELNETGKNLAFETNDYRDRPFWFLEYYQKINIKKLNLNILTSIYGFPEKKLDELIITHKTQNEQNTRIYDGSLVYSKNFETFNKNTIEVSVRNFKKSPYKLNKNQKINQANKQLFEKFVEYLHDQDIKVSFVLIPFYPEAYTFLFDKKEFSFMPEFEAYIKNFAKTKEIPVFGSYNPNIFKIDQYDFYDAMHIRKSGLIKILFDE